MSIYTRLGLLFSCLCFIMVNGCAHQQMEKQADGRITELRQCAEAAYRDDNLDKSEHCYKQLLRADSYTADDWYRLGNIYARTQRLSRAVAAYNEAVLLKPGMADAWFNLGIVQMQQAAKSFLVLQSHADPANPARESSERLLKGILQLIDNKAVQEQP